MGYRFKFDPKAIADIDRAYDRIAEHSPGRADKWYQGLFNRIRTLSSFPLRCPRAPEGEAIGEEVRQVLYGKRPSVYRNLFTIKDEVIEIRAVWHASRGPADT